MGDLLAPPSTSARSAVQADGTRSSAERHLAVRLDARNDKQARQFSRARVGHRCKRREGWGTDGLGHGGEAAGGGRREEGVHSRQQCSIRQSVTARSICSFPVARLDTANVASFRSPFVSPSRTISSSGTKPCAWKIASWFSRFWKTHTAQFMLHAPVAHFMLHATWYSRTAEAPHRQRQRRGRWQLQAAVPGSQGCRASRRQARARRLCSTV